MRDIELSFLLIFVGFIIIVMLEAIENVMENQNPVVIEELPSMLEGAGSADLIVRIASKDCLRLARFIRDGLYREQHTSSPSTEDKT